MSLDDLLITLDAVLEALPNTVDKQHPERLKMIRDILGLVIVTRQQLHR